VEASWSFFWVISLSSPAAAKPLIIQRQWWEIC
jgi:hypothetical protein